MKLNGGYAAIDNRGGSLTVTDADIIIQQGGPAILTATATLTDCTAASSVPGGVTFDATALEASGCLHAQDQAAVLTTPCTPGNKRSRPRPHTCLSAGTF